MKVVQLFNSSLLGALVRNRTARMVKKAVKMSSSAKGGNNVTVAQFVKPIILFVSSNFPPVIGGSSVVYDRLCHNAHGRIAALSAYRDYRNGVQWDRASLNDDSKNYPIFRIPYLRPPLLKSGAGIGSRMLRIITVDISILASVLFSVLRLCISQRNKNGLYW